MNKAVIIYEIENCCNCPNHYIEKIYTPDPWEHEEGCYCSKVEDLNSYNRKHKMVASDDWNLSKYTQVPAWCPYLISKGDCDDKNNN